MGTIISPFKFSNPIKITMFSGGTGSNNLSQSINNITNVSLNILVNAYDDGKSTGTIRHDFNMLGPSDIAKNITVLIDTSKTGGLELKSFMDMRLSKNSSTKELFYSLARISKGTRLKDTPFENAFQSLPKGIRKTLKEYFSMFYNKAAQIAAEKGDKYYDLRDFAVRNLIFTGAFLKSNDYSKAINELSNLLNIKANILLNNSESLWLVGVTENGKILPSEAAITNQLIDQEISDLFLLKAPLSGPDMGNAIIATDIMFDEKADEALKTSDMIIFAPTTFHSSLAPTIMTSGLSSSYFNSNGLKLFIANLVRERGKKTVSEQLLEIESFFQKELGNKLFIHDLLDYIIVNSHGYKTDINSGRTHIPIDNYELRRLGLNVIEDNVEDPDNFGYHLGDSLINLILSIEYLDRGAQHIQKERDILWNILSNPLDYSDKRERAHRLGERILKINDYKDYYPSEITRILIVAGGRSERFNMPYTKAVHPINGKPAIEHIINRAKKFDKDFIVLTNKENDQEIREHIERMGLPPNTISAHPRGTGAQILSAESFIDKAVKNLMIIWADTPNIRKSTMKETLFLHEALGNAVVTMPTCWESDPYAGVERTFLGMISSFFQTRPNPETKREFGEHDAGIFVADRGELFSVLNELNGITSKDEELDLFHAFRVIVNRGKNIAAFAGADMKEAMGFNTIEETKIVEAYHIDLKNNGREEKKDIGISTKNTTPLSEDQIRTIMFSRFQEAISRKYQAAVFDVDENITDDEGNISDQIINYLHGLAKKRIPIAFVSGRLKASLEKKLLSKLIERSENDPEVLKYYYAYPVSGAVGMNLAHLSEKFYENKIPAYISSFAMLQIKSHCLSFCDRYHVTDHKITIWTDNISKQKELNDSINRLLKSLRIPLVARIGGTTKTDAAIIISSSDAATETHKGIALKDFSLRTCIPYDKIVKIGDQGMEGGIDRELLIGMGSFSSNEYDPLSDYQIALSILCGKSNLEAVQWLLPQLKFAPVH